MKTSDLALVHYVQSFWSGSALRAMGCFMSGDMLYDIQGELF